MDRLIDLMKEKFNLTNTKEKNTNFNSSSCFMEQEKNMQRVQCEYTACKAKDLLIDKGIMALPEPRKGHSLNRNMITLVNK